MLTGIACTRAGEGANGPTRARSRRWARPPAAVASSACLRSLSGNRILPDDPTPERVDAWVELAELIQDPEFRATMRRMIEFNAADRDPDVPAGTSGVARTRPGPPRSCAA